MILAPNFDLSEFLASRDHPDLEISPAELLARQAMYLSRLVWAVMVPLRERFGPIRITSGFRSHKLNSAVNGSDSSRHLSGCACDFALIRFPADEAWEIIRRSEVRPTWDRLTFYESSKRFHTDIDGDQTDQRGHLYVARQDGGWRRIDQE